jgi:outer membrane protein TolC
MRIHFFLVSLLIFSLAGSSLAQEPWTLEKCVEYAMTNNLDIQKAGLKNQRNEENYRQSIRNLLPGLSASSGYGASFGKSIDPITNDVVYQSFSSNSFSASTSVSLFQGFRQLNEIAFSKNLYATGHFDEQALKATLSFQIMNAFYNVIFFQGLIEISDSLLEQSRWNQGYIEGMIRNGLIAESDILEVTAAVATGELKKIKSQNEYDQALLQLKQLMNLDSGLPFIIRKEIPEIQSAIRLEHPVDSLYYQALRCLPEIQSTRANVQASRINLQQAKSNFYPSLLFYAGTSTGFYQTRKDSEGNVIPFRDQMSNNASEYLGFSLGIPIFNKGQNRSQTKLARIQVKESELSLMQEQQKLYQRIYQDWKKLSALKMEINQGTKQVKALEAAEAILRKKFEKGLANQYEVSQARNLLASARSELLSTSLQYEITRRTIDYYQGIPIPGMQ